MAKTNAERQKKFRNKQKETLTDLSQAVVVTLRELRKSIKENKNVRKKKPIRKTRI